MTPKKLLIVVALLLSACSGHTVYFGTYSGEVFSAEFYDGAFDGLTSRAVIDNPSYLAVDDGKVYAVSEVDSMPRLCLLESLSSPTFSAGPCHVSVGNGYALVSNYSGGTLSVFKLPLDGSGPVVTVQGSVGGPDSVRQCEPHVHCALFSPDGKHALVSDFSADRLICLSICPDSVNVERTYPLSADTGPRHILFGNDNLVYVIGELSGKITVMSFPDGRILQEIDADPLHTRASADIRLSPDGRHLYASNRLGMDGVAVFDVLSDGLLKPVAYTRTAACPRNIAISPDGKYLLLASQTEDVVEVYPIDPETGALCPLIHTLAVSKPVCILFAD